MFCGSLPPSYHFDPTAFADGAVSRGDSTAGEHEDACVRVLTARGWTRHGAKWHSRDGAVHTAREAKDAALAMLSSDAKT